MKNLLISLMVFMWAGIVNAQFTELKEARVGFDPLLPEMTVDGEKYVIKVKEQYDGEFEKDPVAFLDKYCNIEAFIDLVRDEETLDYQVDINSTKGRMRAKYCKEGNLIRVSCKLKNVLLPPHLQKEVYSKYKGWNMTRNVHIVKGRNGSVQEEYFRIRLQKGDEVQNLKIDMNDLKPVEVAST